MSNDKDIDNFESAEDDLAIENDDSEYEAGDAGDEDFVEEDWENYDEEQLLDDGGGDGGLAARKAAFNRFLIGGALVVVLGGGFFFLKSGVKEENLGAPAIEKTGPVAKVKPDQKAEFYSETNVQSQAAYGVTYGKEGVPAAIEETHGQPKNAAGGLLNDPAALSAFDGQDHFDDTELVYTESEFEEQPAQEEVIKQEQLPMPAPIASNVPPRTEGLIPMPEEQKDLSLNRQDPVKAEQPADLWEDEPVRAVSQDSGTAKTAVSQPESTAAASANTDTAALEAKLGAIVQRLGHIENGLDRLEDIEASLAKLDKRVARLEKAPISASQPSAKTGAAMPKQEFSPAPAAPPQEVIAPAPADKGWVLKSAQPGAAMVSRKGESEIFNIAEGESFADLGKITGIFVENGRWVVEGTKGKITQ